LPASVQRQGIFQIKSKNLGIIAILAILVRNRTGNNVCESLMGRMLRRKHKFVTLDIGVALRPCQSKEELLDYVAREPLSGRPTPAPGLKSSL
jgi:hypothetical protein